MPVLVGSLSHEKEQNYGRLFAKYLTDPENFFVISSDFCHWGKLFIGVKQWFRKYFYASRVGFRAGPYSYHNFHVCVYSHTCVYRSCPSHKFVMYEEILK